MISNEMQLLSNYQGVEHFVETCHSDERVVAVFLRGSYLTAITDNYSDLDLGLITPEQAYHDFLEEITAFISRLDELLAIQKTLLKID